MKRKILYITGTRADYGLMRSVLFRINTNPLLELEIAVTGMHLMPEFGYTLNEILQDGFSYRIIDVTYINDSKQSMALFIGRLIQDLVVLTDEIKPDYILLLGDRGEMLAGAIVGAYLGIPVAHIHGGEVTSTVDEIARHAITKLSHIHFPATEESAERIIKMGEDPQNVFVVGAPGLEQILDEPLVEKEELSVRYHFDPKSPLILVIQHPVSHDARDPAFQMEQTRKAIRSLDIQTIIIYPNADSGGRSMINVIKQFESIPKIQMFSSIPHNDYLSLLKIASVLVGNSSSGIIEAPSFGLPVVNIGDRQKGRQMGENIIDTGYNTFEIVSAVNKALYDEEFKQRVKQAKNPYGDGNSSKKIVDLLEKICLNRELLQKRMSY